MLLQVCNDFQNEVQRPRCVKYRSDYSSLIMYIGKKKSQDVLSSGYYGHMETQGGAVTTGILGLVNAPLSPFVLL